MTDYTKAVNFATKDALAPGDPNKVAKGTEVNTEFDAIAVAVATKSNKVAVPTTNNLLKQSATGDLVDADSITDDGSEVEITTGNTFNVKDASGLKIADVAVTSTAAELNILDGVTSTTAELNILDGVTATTAELNILDGVTSTAAELNYNDLTTVGVLETNKTVTTDASNNIAMPDGKGIDFSAYTDGSVSGTTTTQVLIDFEEGDWVPFIADATLSDSESQTYGTRFGRYSKIGRLVFFEFYVGITSFGTLTLTQDAHIGGLPYTANAAVNGHGNMTCTASNALDLTVVGNITGTITGGTNRINLLQWDALTGATLIQLSQLDDGTANVSLSGYGSYSV